MQKVKDRSLNSYKKKLIKRIRHITLLQMTITQLEKRVLGWREYLKYLQMQVL